MRLRYILLIVIIILTTAACSLLPKRAPATKRYIPGGEIHFENIQPEKNSKTLEVWPTKAPPDINSVKILYSKSPVTRGEYRYAEWTEPPPGRFNRLMRKAIEASGVFFIDTPGFGQVNSSFILITEIDEFSHKAYLDPPKVAVKIDATLKDAVSGKTLDKKSFNKIRDISENNSEAAVSGFNSALAEILDELVGWLRGLRQGAPVN